MKYAIHNNCKMNELVYEMSQNEYIPNLIGDVVLLGDNEEIPKDDDFEIIEVDEHLRDYLKLIHEWNSVIETPLFEVVVYILENNLLNNAVDIYALSRESGLVYTAKGLLLEMEKSSMKDIVFNHHLNTDTLTELGVKHIHDRNGEKVILKGAFKYNDTICAILRHVGFNVVYTIDEYKSEEDRNDTLLYLPQTLNYRNFIANFDVLKQHPSYEKLMHNILFKVIHTTLWNEDATFDNDAIEHLKIDLKNIYYASLVVYKDAFTGKLEDNYLEDITRLVKRGEKMFKEIYGDGSEEQASDTKEEVGEYKPVYAIDGNYDYLNTLKDILVKYSVPVKIGGVEKASRHDMFIEFDNALSAKEFVRKITNTKAFVDCLDDIMLETLSNVQYFREEDSEIKLVEGMNNKELKAFYAAYAIYIGEDIEQDFLELVEYGKTQYFINYKEQDVFDGELKDTSLSSTIIRDEGEINGDNFLSVTPLLKKIEEFVCNDTELSGCHAHHNENIDEADTENYMVVQDMITPDVIIFNISETNKPIFAYSPNIVETKITNGLFRSKYGKNFPIIMTYIVDENGLTLTCTSDKFYDKCGTPEYLQNGSVKTTTYPFDVINLEIFFHTKSLYLALEDKRTP